MDLPSTSPIPSDDLSAMDLISILDSHTISSEYTKEVISRQICIEDIWTYFLHCGCRQMRCQSVTTHLEVEEANPHPMLLIPPNFISRGYISSCERCNFTSYIVHATEGYISLQSCTERSGMRTHGLCYPCHPNKYDQRHRIEF